MNRRFLAVVDIFTSNFRVDNKPHPCTTAGISLDFREGVCSLVAGLSRGELDAISVYLPSVWFDP